MKFSWLSNQTPGIYLKGGSSWKLSGAVCDGSLTHLPPAWAGGVVLSALQQQDQSVPLPPAVPWGYVCAANWLKQGMSCMGCSSKWRAFMLPVVSTTVWRFLIFQNIPVHNAIRTSGLVCVGEACPDIAAELLDTRLQLQKKGTFMCVMSPHFSRAMGMGAMRNPDKWLRCSGLNHDCSPGKLGWLHIPF